MNSLPAQPPSPDSSRKSKTPRRSWIIWILVLAGIGLLMLFKEQMDSPAEFISQYEFEKLVDSDQIKHATINYNSQNTALNEVVGIYFKTSENAPKSEVPFRAKVRLTEALERKLLTSPQFQPYESNSVLMSVFFSILPIVVVAALIWFFFIRQIRKAAKNAEGVPNLQARTIQQQDRFDKVLTKWEEQARRMDAVLDGMEKDHGPRR